LGLVVTLLSAACGPIAPAGQDRPQRLCWIVVDGTHLNFDLAPMPFLSELIAQGTYYPNAWVGQVPNNTPTGHATLGTGAFPKHHGIIDFQWRVDPERPADPVVKLMETGTFEAGGQPVWDQMNRYGATTLAQIAKEQAGATVWGIASRKGFAAGAWLGQHGDVLLFPWVEKLPDGTTLRLHLLAGAGFEPPDPAFLGRFDREVQAKSQADLAQIDTWAADVAIGAIQAYRPDILLINFSKPDEIGHQTGGIDGDAPEPLIRALVNVDEQIRRIYQAYQELGLADETLFVVQTDHGMSQATAEWPFTALVDLLASINLEEVYRGPREQMWFADPSRSGQAAELVLRELGDDFLAASYRDPASGEYTTLLSPDVSQAAAPELQATLGYLLNTTAAGPQAADLRLMPRQTFGDDIGEGRHYHLAWPVQHIWLVLAGPGIKQGTASDYPARLVDILPTVTALLYPGYESSWDGLVLADALLNARKEWEAAQAEIGEELSRYQSALKGLEAESGQR